MAPLTAYKWAAVNENWAPLSGVEVEALNLTTLKPDDVQRTGLDGIVTFTGLPAGPHIPRVRARRVSTKVGGQTFTGQIRLIPVAMGNQGITKHFIVDAGGMGTHTTVQTAFTAALAQTDNYVVIYCNPGAYDELVTCDFGDFAGTGELFIYLVGEGSVSNWYSGFYNKVVNITTPAAGAASPTFTFDGVGSIQMHGIYVDGRSGGAVKLGDGATDDLDFEARNCGFDCSGAQIFPGTTGSAASLRVFDSVITAAAAPLIPDMGQACRYLFHHCRINTKGGLVAGNFGTLEFVDCKIYPGTGLANWWIEEAALVNSLDLRVEGCYYHSGGSGFIKVGQSNATTSNVRILNNVIENDAGDTAIYLIGILRCVVKNNIIIGTANDDGGIGIRVSEGSVKFQAGLVDNNSFDLIQTGLQVDASATDGSNVFGPNAYGDVGTDTTGVPAAEDYQVSLSTASCALLDGTIHTDTVAQGVTAGSIIIGNDTPAWDELAISVPGANILNVLGITNGETTPSWKTVLDGTNPANIANSASPGTSLVFAHRDHVHAHPAGLTATLHHTKYTGGEAILAIQGEATLDLEGDVTIAEGKGLSVGGSAVADQINVTTSDGDDPYLKLITTLSGNGDVAHEFCLHLDQSAANDHLELSGRTVGVDTIVCVKAVADKSAILQVHADAGYGRLIMGVAGGMNLKNTVEDGDIRFTVDDGGTDKYLYIDGATFTLLSSTGIIDFGATDLVTSGHLAVAGATLDTDFALYVAPTFTQTAGSTWARGIYGWVLADPASASASEFQGIRALVQSDAGCAQNFTAAQGLVGLSFAAQHLGSGLATGVYGCNFYADIGGSGNVTTGMGFRMRGRTLPDSSGHFVTYYNLYIDSFLVAGSGAATNLYGIYIADLSQGTSLNYGIYFAGTSGLARQGIWWNGDTNLYRSAANVLKTDDAFSATGAITSGGVVTGTQMQTGNATGMKLCLYSTTYGLGLQSSLMEFIVPAAARHFRWGYGTSGSLTECLHLDTSLKRLKIGGDLSLVAIASDPAYVDGQAILYFYSSGGVDELRVRGKVGATETEVTLADFTP